MDTFEIVCSHDPLDFCLKLFATMRRLSDSPRAALKGAHINFKLGDSEPVIEALLVTAPAGEPGARRIPD